MNSFYCTLFASINMCLLFELISFIINDIVMAIAIRTMILIMISFPIVNKLVDTRFAYYYHQSSSNALLSNLFIEDLLMFMIVRRGSNMFHYLILVFIPLFILYYYSNKDYCLHCIHKVTTFIISYLSYQSENISIV